MPQRKAIKLHVKVHYFHLEVKMVKGRYAVFQAVHMNTERSSSCCNRSIPYHSFNGNDGGQNLCAKFIFKYASVEAIV